MAQAKSIRLQPFLKWAGGKRWLISQEPSIFPEKFETYFEPFLGGGAVFFHLAPSKAVLSDINEELIDTYQAIKQNWKLVRRYLVSHHNMHCKEYYYNTRSLQAKSLCSRAARMLYLNRTCWNGLYRVNLKGTFNVPIGSKTNVLLETDDFQSTAALLSNASIYAQDFENTINQAGSSDFVFIDPPYTVKHNLNGFIKYNETLFAWEDQVRLKDAVDRAVGRGAKVLVLNAAHESIRELYADYDQIELTRKNLISGKVQARGKYEELAICCGYSTNSNSQQRPLSSLQDCRASLG